MFAFIQNQPRLNQASRGEAVADARKVSFVAFVFTIRTIRRVYKKIEAIVKELYTYIIERNFNQ